MDENLLEEAFEMLEERIEALNNSGKKVILDHLIEDIQCELNMSSKDAMEFSAKVFESID